MCEASLESGEDDLPEESSPMLERGRCGAITESVFLKIKDDKKLGLLEKFDESIQSANSQFQISHNLPNLE